MITSPPPATLLGLLSVSMIRTQVFKELPLEDRVELSCVNKACCQYYREQDWLQKDSDHGEVFFSASLLDLLGDNDPKKQKEGWQLVRRLIKRALSFEFNERPFDEVLKQTLNNTQLSDLLPATVNQAEATFNIESAYQGIFDKSKDLFEHFLLVFCGADSALSGLNLDLDMDDKETVELIDQFSAIFISNTIKCINNVKTAIERFIASVEESKKMLKTGLFWRLFLASPVLFILASEELNWLTAPVLTVTLGLLLGQLGSFYRQFQAFDHLRVVLYLEDFERRLNEIQPIMVSLLRHEHQLKIKISEGRKLNKAFVASSIETREKSIATHRREQNQQLQKIAKEVGTLQEKLPALFPAAMVKNQVPLKDFA